MRIFRKGAVALLALLLLIGCFACGDPGDPGDNSSNTPSGTQQTITINLPIDSDSEAAFRNVANVYTSMKQEEGVRVRVNIVTNQDPVGYTTAMNGLLQYPDRQPGDIIQANVVTQYFGSGRLVDFTPYLNQPNPYSENKIWATTLREDAYRADDKTQQIFNLSMEGNAFIAFYNKDTFEQCDLSAPTTWEELINALETLKKNGYDAPLGLNFDDGGLDGNNFNWVSKMYMDQYFRDMIDVGHSQSSDYSFIPEIDGDWGFDPANPTNDARNGYTYNFTRVVNAYFKDGSTFNTTSARYADMMTNLKTLASYSSSDRDNTAVRQQFQNDAIVAAGAATDSQYPKKDRVAVMLLRLDYLTDHQKSVGAALGMGSGVIPVDQMSEMVGWFDLPAMPQHDGEGSPYADNLRTLGGPDHHPLALVNRDPEHNALCIDFLQFLFSEQGFDAYYQYYANLGKVCPMQIYLKDYELPDAVKLEGIPTYDGDCSTNPYTLFAGNYTENTGVMAPNGNVQDLINAQIKAYLLADSGAEWSTYGQNIFEIMKAGFTDYAEWRELKHTDLEWYVSADVNFAEDPMQ